MPSEQDDRPAGTAAESHWGTKAPEDQPSRDEVVGLKRLVIEARARLGPDTTPEAIAADLRARNIAADPADIAKCCAEPY